MKKTVGTFLLVLVMLVATFGIASAVTNGVPDAGRHPYVGLLVFDTAPGQPAWRCSGSLISPTVVLTAGHCTEGAVDARVWFADDITPAAVPPPLYPFGGAGSGAIEGTPYTNPDFCQLCQGPGNGLPNFSFRDVGVVVLDEPVFMDEYAQLPEAGLVSTLAPKADVDLVGYGVQEQVMAYPGQPPFDRWVGPRIRMFAPSEIVSTKFSFADEYLRLAMNPGGGSGGTCFGDSGGPDLLAGTNVVVGVNSFVTNVNCTGVGYSTRVDNPEVLAWIMIFLD